MIRRTYDPAPEYDADGYRVTGYDGVAWYVRGHETEPVSILSCPDCGRIDLEREHGGGRMLDAGNNPDCEHKHASYEEEPEYERTGRLVLTMIGDDRQFTFDPDELTPLSADDYCPECGQIGCKAYASARAQVPA